MLEETVAMKFQYHHMNLCTENVSRLSEFYQTIFAMDRIEDEEHTRVNVDDGYGAQVDFVTDGAIEFHLATRDVNLGFKMKQHINPLDRGHFCFRTDDIEGFKKRLDELGIQYADYGVWAIANWYQIFLHDPDGNIIEVHQPMTPAAKA
jgi:catechol 2,3-dioxygenase-like lactoylglutathione lyase family enzyme